MPRVKVNGWRFLYRQAGRGSDVVLLPGAANAPASRPLFDALTADFRVTIYQARGGAVHSADGADDLHALQARLRLSPAYLVARGVAALVALHAAVLYPEGVAGVILTEPALPGVRDESERGSRSGLTMRRIHLIEQPVVVLCGARSPALPLCRHLADHLTHCEAATLGENAVGLAATIHGRLRELAGLVPHTNGAATNGEILPGPRIGWPRFGEASDGHLLTRWMARLSAWGF